MEGAGKLRDPEWLSQMGLHPLPGTGDQGPTLNGVTQFALAAQDQIAPIQELIRKGCHHKGGIGDAANHEAHQITRQVNQREILRALLQKPPLAWSPGRRIGEEGGGKQKGKSAQMKAGVAKKIVARQAQQGGTRLGYQKRTIHMIRHPAAAG